MRRIGIYLFDEVEVLDFAGPFEVFSVASRLAVRNNALASFEVVTIGTTGSAVTTRGGLSVQPSVSLADADSLDVLIVPGGVMDREVESATLLAWVRRCAETCEVVASICTGAFVLAAAGLLDDRNVTTHWEDVLDLRAFAPRAKVLEDVRWVDEGSTVTAAGISAGIDMSLHLVARFEGLDFARATARQMDYVWEARANKRISAST